MVRMAEPNEARKFFKKFLELVGGNFQNFNQLFKISKIFPPSFVKYLLIIIGDSAAPTIPTTY